MNDGVVSAASCCLTRVPATAADVARLAWIYQGRLKVGDLISGPPHEPHRTREEAERCYHAWVLSSLGLGWVAGEREDLDPDRDVFSNWAACEAVVGWVESARFDEPPVPVTCGAPTKKGAYYRDLAGPNMIALCAPEHYTIDVARTLVRRSTQLTYS
jgi:hypothetical protein